MDYKSNYSTSSVEYINIIESNEDSNFKKIHPINLYQPQPQQPIIAQSKPQESTIRTTLVKSTQNNNNNDNNNNIIENCKNNINNNNQLSPLLSYCMKIGLIFEFLMVTISLLQYGLNFQWYNDINTEDSVENYWPINKYYGLFIISIIFNGLISAWKGYKVDQRLFFAAHHFVTMCFFLICFTTVPSIRFFMYLECYLVMRVGKRIKDEGYMNKDQWIKFYVSYAYIQTLLILIIVSLVPNTSSLLEVLGCVAHIDSLITCRKEDFSGKLLNGNSKWLIPLSLIKNSTITQKILSTLDVATLWILLIIGTNGLNIFQFNFYKVMIPFCLIEFVIKPLFHSFKRPFYYKYTKSSSFPSAHTAIVSIVVCSNNSLSPIERFIYILLMAMYRVYTRAHTVEDVCAGLAFGQSLYTLTTSMYNLF